jgi:tetratricopeptide (TPR) repeat protein
MDTGRLCLRCGQAIPWGQTQCPICSEERGYMWSLRREAFLLVIFLLLAFLFGITSFAVRSFRAVQKHLAEEWYSHGEQDLKAGRADLALTDFRNALSYSPNSILYRLRLSQALAETGRTQEARTYLLNLWEEEPGNGTVNLGLARVAAREHEVSEAVRYYHAAVYGEWNDNPVTRRVEVRLELVRFLLASDQKVAARAELIALEPDLPPDAELQTSAGTLLLQVGAYDDALKLFRQALVMDSRLTPALAEAGECYFETGHYLQAQRYLERAVQQDSHLPGTAAMLDTTRAVLNLDPFNRRLGERERARRAKQAFGQAMARLEACAQQRGIDLHTAGGEQLQSLYSQAAALEPRVVQQNLSRDSVLLSNAMDVVFAIEQTTARACGEPQGMDLALFRLAREQGGARP